MGFMRALVRGVGVVIGAANTFVNGNDGASGQNTRTNANTNNNTTNDVSPTVTTQGAGQVYVNEVANFQMNGNFLLDTQNGRVWLYDTASKQFVLVKKQTNPLEDLLVVTVLTETKDDLFQEFTGMTTAEQKKYKYIFERTNLALDSNIAEVFKGLTPTKPVTPK